ncbi:carboxypeptidase-like regulatory domain-containing protein [Bacteroidota bacterium]
MNTTFKIILAAVFYFAFCFTLLGQEQQITDSRGTPVPMEYLKRVSINFVNLSIYNALDSVAELGGFHLNYNEEIIPPDILVTMIYESIPAIYALKHIIDKADLEFVISKGGQIAIIESSPAGPVESERQFTIKGHITDSKTGEALYGTNIFIGELQSGGSSNRYGFYSLTLPEGYYKIRYSYVGYKSFEQEIMFNGNITQNIELEDVGVAFDTLVVLGELEDFGFGAPQMGTVQVSPENIKNIPVLLGEQDLLKTLQLLPGVTNSREGDAGYYVRGGDADQNLILLDEAPVYNAYHFMGLFSVFNTDAIKSATLMKGSSPPKYGGRISSVLDIQMNEGNKKEFNGEAGIGLIFSRATIQGPLFNNKGSYLISGRRTYLDLFTKLFAPGDASGVKLYFYDLNLKGNYIISEKDRLYVSGYLGRDGLGFEDAVDLVRGNTTATLRWNHLLNDKMFSNTSFIFSNYTFQTGVYENEGDEDIVEFTSKINDLTIKEDLQYFVDRNNRIEFGFNYIYHSFLGGNVRVADRNEDWEITIGKRNAHEGAVYLSHEFKPTSSLNLNYGLRYSLFSVIGDADDFNFNDEPDDIDFQFNKADEKFYHGLEPRISATFITSDSTSLKMAYSRNFQYIHMITNANSGTPFDIWRPSNSKIKPQIADQFSLGFFKDFENHKYEFSVELFYKNLYNQIAPRDGSNVAWVNYFDSELVFGKGWAYGAEFLLRKKLGRLNGWIGYSVSKSMRKFNEINGGKPYPAKYDRTHDFSIVLNYQLDHKWMLSANWVYSSGYNITIPYGNYNIEGNIFRAYSDRNAYRLPQYHRLDIGISYTTDGGNIWNLSLYNAYGRRNAYAILFRQNEYNPANLDAVRLSLFSIVPSLSYTFKF